MNEKEVIESFYQGSAGNCASISVIKLAIATYGVDAVFKNVETLTDKYVITLRNDVKIELLKSELVRMDSMDKFIEKDNYDVFAKAKFIYAVMAKNRFLLNPNLGFNNIEDAAIKKKTWFLGKDKYLLSMDTEDNFAYIGLGGLWDKVNATQVDNYQRIIITNIYHSAFATNGYYDEYGNVILISEFKNYHSRNLNTDLNYILKL